MTVRFDAVVFDVDGTLVEHPERKTVWEVLNRRFTGDDTVNRERFEAHLDGRLSYADWVSLDVAGWKEAGATRGDLVEALEPLRLVEGARETLDALKERGLRLIVISGTLNILLETFLPEYPFDEVYCNRLHFDADGRISSWSPTPFDMRGKVVALKAIAMREDIPLSRFAFVGDSLNDVWIARKAGYTVAFNPDSSDLEKEADAVVHSRDLRDVLPHLLDHA